MKALFDTAVLTDYLLGKEAAKRELERYSAGLISAVSVAELLAEANTEEAPIIRAWLEGFEIVPIDAAIAQDAAQLMQSRGLDLQAALIWASAQQLQLLFVTRNASNLPNDDVGIRVPY
jgi:predicted nucleic acid-binding protein